MTGRHNRNQRNRSSRRLLLVSHRSIDQAGGPAARWRSFVHYLPEHGWEVDVLAARSHASAGEFSRDESERRRTAVRAQVMSRVGKIASPAFRIAGIRPEAMPLSTAWIPRAAAVVRRRLESGRYEAALATGPPFAALIAARIATRGDAPPLVVELRDLWAGNPSFDRGGRLLPSLEKWVLSGSEGVVAMSPEATKDLRRRHPDLSDRVHEIPNGFEPQLLERRGSDPAPDRPIEILHSGTLTADRPLTPLLDALGPDFRLVLHGYVAPEIRREIEQSGRPVEIVPPSGWEDAVSRIAEADVALVTQARGAGDATAVAAKVYEYLALGKPVLCVSHGGATEALLQRLGADELSARLDDPRSIEAALERLRAGDLPQPIAAKLLAPYERPRLAQRMAELLDSVASQRVREHVDDSL
jgi:glycosyltransferase involved in cell wall biosynthesis